MTRFVTITIVLEVNDDHVDSAYQAARAAASYEEDLEDAGIPTEEIKLLKFDQRESTINPLVALGQIPMRQLGRNRKSQIQNPK